MREKMLEIQSRLYPLFMVLADLDTNLSESRARRADMEQKKKKMDKLRFEELL
jgi:hypothetical protein